MFLIQAGYVVAEAALTPKETSGCSDETGKGFGVTSGAPQGLMNHLFYYYSSFAYSSFFFFFSPPLCTVFWLHQRIRNRCRVV